MIESFLIRILIIQSSRLIVFSDKALKYDEYDEYDEYDIKLSQHIV